MQVHQVDQEHLVPVEKVRLLIIMQEVGLVGMVVPDHQLQVVLTHQDLHIYLVT